MKPPVEEVRVSAQGKEILIKLKRRTGLMQWNHLCRIAYCRSLANPTRPCAPNSGEGGLRMDWRTFTGPYHEEFACLNALRAQRDGIDLTHKESLAEYFRAHLERGIAALNDLQDIRAFANSEDAEVDPIS
jgi:DNA sulfur modification protein DndE